MVLFNHLFDKIITITTLSNGNCVLAIIYLGRKFIDLLLEGGVLGDCNGLLLCLDGQTSGVP